MNALKTVPVCNFDENVVDFNLYKITKEKENMSEMEIDMCMSNLNENDFYQYSGPKTKNKENAIRKMHEKFMIKFKSYDWDNILYGSGDKA